MSRFTGKKAVVTGGTHGMGLAIAKSIVDGGGEVLVTGRNEAKIEEAASVLGAADRVIKSDAALLADIDSLAVAAEQRLGTLDALFVNHGIAEITPFAEITEEAYDRVFDINAKGSFFTVQRLEPLLADGSAVVFTTVANDRAFGGISTYSGSKEAVRAFAQILAAEFLPRRIRVNAVAPGFIKTPTMGVAGLTEAERIEFEKQGNEVTPLGRNGTVEEIAAAALFLAFDATFSTNVEFPVDGGYAQGVAVE